MSIANATVNKLFIKQERKTEMAEATALDLRLGWGILGNINSNEISPRQVLVVCSSELKRLAIAPGELRENIVLDLDNVEAFKPGAKLSFPSGAVIRLTFYCEPCKHVAHLVDSVKSLERNRGILGVAINSGAIAVTDKVIVEPNYFPALSEIPYERFLDYVRLIPRGKVVTYQQVIQGIGVDRSYFRAIPMYLKKAPIDCPVHRVVDSQGKVTPHVAEQKAKLTAEGIEVIGRYENWSVCLTEYLWRQKAVYQ